MVDPFGRGEAGSLSLAYCCHMASTELKPQLLQARSGRDEDDLLQHAFEVAGFAGWLRLSRAQTVRVAARCTLWCPRRDSETGCRKSCIPALLPFS